MGEDKEKPNEDSETGSYYSSDSERDSYYSSDSDTATTSAPGEEEEKEEEEEEDVGNDNISDAESEVDSEEEKLKDLLQQAGERVPESLLEDDSQFIIDEKPSIFLLNVSNYPNSVPDSPLPLQRSGGTSRPPSLLGEYQAYLEAAHLVATEPRNFAQPTTGEYPDEWKKSMKAECDALMEHHVWDVIPRPTTRKVVGKQWHYVHKLGPAGEITPRKSRFVAKAYSQVNGIHYQETIFPVFRYESLCILFALVASLPARNWKTKERDVKNPFLNGTLKEEVLIEQPKGFEKGNNQVLRL